MIDWPKCAEAFDDKAAEKLVKSRGYSKDMVSWLREKQLIGLHGRCVAFPTDGGAHFKCVDGKGNPTWRYTPGAKPSPFVIGQIEEGAHVHCFESQWCCISYSDVAGERNNIVATRGASNAKLVTDLLKDHSGVIYLWPQNDEPGKKWAIDIRKLLPGAQIKVCVVPGEYKDLNEFIKGGGTPGAVWNIYIDAIDYEKSELNNWPNGPSKDSQLGLSRDNHQAIDLSEVPSAQTEHRDARPSPGPRKADKHNVVVPEMSSQPALAAICNLDTDNLTAVPVLAEPKRQREDTVGLEATGSERITTECGEASGESCEREGTPSIVAPGFKSGDSRGGGQSISPNCGADSMSALKQGGETISTEKGGDASCSLLGTPTGISNAARTVQAPSAAAIVTLAQALDAIEALFHKYVRFPEPWHAAVCTLWAAYTWIWKAFDYTPYLLIRGPEENCGKTRVLKCLLALAPKVFGGNIACNVSGPAMFREIEDEQPVFLLDEVDKFFSFGTDDPVVGLLNAGYERGGTAMRNNMRTGKNEKFSVFCPKALAGIGDKVDNTTASRAIHIHMARQATDDMAEPFRSHIVTKEVYPIRIFLSVWGESATKLLQGVFPELPKELANDGRKAEITEPLIAVADMAGPEWAGKAREDLVCAFDQPKDDSEGTKLLRSIKTVFKTCNLDRITSHALVEYLVKDDEGPWASWWERDFAAGRWHGAAHKISKMLKPYRIHSKNVRVGEEQGKGYDKADFESAWAKYLPSQLKAENMELQLV